MRSDSESKIDLIEVKECKKTKYEAKNNLIHVCKYDNCNKLFKRLYRLKRHERQHSGERPFICGLEGCERSFTCKTYLNKHMKRPHNITNNEIKAEEKILKQYNCGECEKTFKTKFQLRTHSYQHNGQKPFSCEKCHKEFVTQSKLKSHSKTHEGYHCGRDGCDFVTYKWTELRKHIALQHKCSLKCELCDKMFNNRYNLNSHKETVHSEVREKIVCSYEGCDRSYAKKSGLMTHIRSFHSKEQYKCTFEECDKLFKHKKSLKKHLDNHLNPKPLKTKNKIIRRKCCKAVHLSGIELMTDQIEEIMTQDKQFRNECISNAIELQIYL